MAAKLAEAVVRKRVYRKVYQGFYIWRNLACTYCIDDSLQQLQCFESSLCQWNVLEVRKSVPR